AFFVTNRPEAAEANSIQRLGTAQGSIARIRQPEYGSSTDGSVTDAGFIVGIGDVMEETGNIKVQFIAGFGPIVQRLGRIS
ncbi:MAG TPA: hypothetical protein VHZ55_12460, partial [Bryobacteraceae bacterium]|nr:hypothetical protein [Bryobacteraceae bacterium]